MTATAIPSGNIIFPKEVPLSGYQNTLAALDALGCLLSSGFEPSLGKAGLARVGEDPPTLSFKTRGLFQEGVGPAAMELIEALAKDGFEGWIDDRAGVSGRAFILAEGSLSPSGLSAPT